jgi:DNA-binding NarL/FixJ family response regulator
MRLVIAEGAPVLRDGLALLLGREGGLTVVGRAGTARELLRLAVTAAPDVALVDAELPGGPLERLLPALEEKRPSLRTLLLAANERQPSPAEVVLLGARGIVAKDADGSLLRKAIRAVASGEYWMGHGDVAELLRRLRGGTGRRAGVGPERTLSREDRLVALGVASGESNKEVAAGLGLTEAAVKSRLTRVYRALGVANRAELAALVTRQGFESTPSDN